MNVTETLLFIVIIVFIVWFFLISCRKGHPMLDQMKQFRFAHRGLHDSKNGIPENSMPAFRRAAEQGYGIELDVHLTKDGRLAVIHDDSLLRTAGVDVKASDLTAEELGQYRLEGTDEKIPFLEEVLPLFEEKAPIIVELKVEKNAAALAEAACNLLSQFKVSYAIESFHPQAIRWLKKNRPQVCRGQLSQNFLKGNGTGLGKLADFAMTNCLTGFLTEPDFIAYNHEHRNGQLSLKLARLLCRVQEVSWTVRTREDMERCEKDDCLIIFEHFIP